MSVPDWADGQLSRDLPELRARGENQNLEYMESFPLQVRDLAKEIAAFATSNAGTILIGVSNAGDPVGLSEAGSADGRDGLLRRIEGICRGTVKPSITPTAKFALENGQVVLVLLVAKGNQPLYYSNNIPYVRHITESRPAEPHEVIDLVRQWLAANECAEPEENPYGMFVSRLASLLVGVLIFGEEATDRARMVNPWLDMWRAQFQQTATELRAIAIRDIAIEHGVSAQLDDLAQSLDTVAKFRLHSGCVPELAALIQEAMAKAQKVREEIIDPVPVSPASLDHAKETIILQSRRLSGLLERAVEMLQDGRFEEVQAEVGEIGYILLRASYYNVDSLRDGLSKELRDVGRDLHLVETMQVYMDGGASVQAICNRVKQGCTYLNKIVASLPNGSTETR